MPATPAYCRRHYLITTNDFTGGGYAWGLREDLHRGHCAAHSEIGCIDAPRFLPGGATQLRWIGRFYAQISTRAVFRSDVP